MKYSVFNSVLRSLLVASLIAVSSIPMSFADTDAAKSMKDKLESIVKDSIVSKSRSVTPEISSTVEDPARPKPLPKSASDPKTKQLYEIALQDYYRYRSEGLEHRKEVFKWQLFSAKIIFIIVLSLVATGILFAGIQFRIGLNQKVSGAATEINVGKDGVTVSSPILGVIILFFSLGFFYLYLLYVYPIDDIF